MAKAKAKANTTEKPKEVNAKAKPTEKPKVVTEKDACDAPKEALEK
jgi:hypothetical protein